MSEAPSGAPSTARREIDALLHTALWTATCRADEATRASPLVVDPFAGRLCGPEGLAIGRALEREGRAHTAILVRTRVIDERIAAAVVADGIRQVALLGAGLDARAFRLALPPRMRWLEVDFPETVAWKRERLPEAPVGLEHELHALDLRSTVALGELLDRFAGDERVLVVLEGVVPYLSPAEAEALLGMLAARKVTVLCDLGGGAWGAAIARSTARVVAGQGAPFRTRIGDPAAWLERIGFRVTANVSLVDWDAARTDRRWNVPWTARVFPGYRDAARVLEAVTRATQP
ncbi:MAG: class I SAM-dependent methyltransferase [Deltaproteobacteria bacterium]|nr:class I SAM-dependent methyltransferase [Deltaproteobacteria bacterium]